MLFDLLFAFLFAVIFWLVLGVLFGRNSWEFPYIFLLIILFSLTWVGGIWLTPIGVEIWGSYWLSFFIVALFISLLFAATTPPKKRRMNIQSESEISTAANVIGSFVWILLLFALIGVLIYYV